MHFGSLYNGDYNSTSRMVITGAGNVGIGTASPNNPLHINGGASDIALQITNNATGTAASDGFSITVENPTPDVVIRQRENNNMRFLTNNTERMRISNNGYVGIGTTNDGHVFNIDSKEVDDAYTPTSYNDKGQLSIYVKNTENNYAGINFSHDGGTEGFLGFVRTTSTSDIGEFVFQGYDGGVNAYKEYMRINHGGIVTIPSQPSFRVGRSAGNVNAGTYVVHNVVKHNVGSHYSTSNGRFTAPVAGSYQFNVRLINSSGGYNTDLAALRINGSAANAANMHDVASVSHAGNSLSTTFYLSAGDYVQVYSQSHTVYGTAEQHCQFSGHLIG
jgi:hypothetical protein